MSPRQKHSSKPRRKAAIADGIDYCIVSRYCQLSRTHSGEFARAAARIRVQWTEPDERMRQIRHRNRALGNVPVH
ncbi:unnamed protein product [Strongylus vulgaris]|uniref:Uncharacterized protein n=1 Tax=Strongylus vulgaris TaxID=40348 RepID=A0A3P7J723_STRVU|nr:unnamed protein product [Strongylus vulgaris]